MLCWFEPCAKRARAPVLTHSGFSAAAASRPRRAYTCSPLRRGWLCCLCAVSARVVSRRAWSPPCLRAHATNGGFAWSRAGWRELRARLASSLGMRSSLLISLFHRNAWSMAWPGIARFAHGPMVSNRLCCIIAAAHIGHHAILKASPTAGASQTWHRSPSSMGTMACRSAV